MLLHELDRAERVGLGRREELLEAAAHDVRAAERVRRANQREEVVALVELLERVREPLDVRRRRGRVLGRSEERERRRRTSARPPRSPPSPSTRPRARRRRSAAPSRSRTRAAGDRRAAGRSCAARAPSPSARGRTRPPGARSPQPGCRRRAPSAPGSGTPSRSAARRTAPTIASSSERRPAATSRAAEVVVSSAISSMIDHCAEARSATPSALGDLARLRDRRLEPRTPVRVAAQLADRLARGRGRGRERRDPRELVPEDALLVLSDPDVEPRLAQDLRRRLDLAAREALRRDA